MEELQELMEEVSYHRTAGECIAAFYGGLSKIPLDERLELTRSWMWHMWPENQEEVE